MTLEELRSALEEIDRSIVELVARRQHLSAEIGRTKRAAGLSPRNYTREKEVIDKVRAHASTLGVSPDLAEGILAQLIRASLTVQEHDRVVTESTGEGKTALLIGGAGKMGRWFARFLSTQGYRVEIADPVGAVEGFAHRSDWTTSALEHDLIIVAAPLRISNDILLAIAGRKPRGLVFDIGSLKTPLRPGLFALRDAGVRVASIHPMFGPDTELLSGQHVIFVDLGNVSAMQAAESLFQPTMAVRVRMDLESHDRVMAFVLGLSHALNIAFFTALAESGEDAPRLSEVSSTTFARQKAIAQAVAAENPHLYFEIQYLNEYGDTALASLESAVARVRNIIRNGNEQEFRTLMTSGLRFLS